MSGTPENRWSQVGARPSQSTASTSRDRGSSSQQRSQTTTSNQPRTNAWAGGRSTTPTTTSTTSTPAPAPVATANMPAATAEKYTSLGNFNGNEVEEYMKRVSQHAIVGDTNNTAQYKASEDGTASKAAWGQKPTNMANGQDFWVQLKKQIASAQQDG